MMGCFARIDRHGKLEFVQFRAEQDDLGMIIPVREIPASQRIKTNFADGVVRITRLSMRNSDGGLSSASATSASTSKRSIELELERNPLIISASSKPLKTFLKDILRVLKSVYFRPFDSCIANDPALDAGDYVRLRGGSIDTQRGYATGIITHNTWVYRGVQTIVNMGSIPAMYMIDDVNTASVAALSDDTETEEETDKIDGEQVVYVQPRSQTEKRLDELEAEIQNAGGLPAPITMSVTEDCEYGDRYRGFVIQDPSGTHKVSVVKNAISIGVGGNTLRLSEDGFVATVVPSFTPQGTVAMLTLKPDGTFQVIMTKNGSTQTSIDMERTRFDIRLIYGDGSGENRLDFNGEGLFINHKRVLTEE